jgi:hypothetical protein
VIFYICEIDKNIIIDLFWRLMGRALRTDKKNINSAFIYDNNDGLKYKINKNQ